MDSSSKRNLYNNTTSKMSNLDCDSNDSDMLNYEQCRLNIPVLRSVLQESIAKIKDAVSFGSNESYTANDVDSMFNVLKITFCNLLAKNDSDAFMEKLVKRSVSRTASFCENGFNDSTLEFEPKPKSVLTGCLNDDNQNESATLDSSDDEKLTTNGNNNCAEDIDIDAFVDDSQSTDNEMKISSKQTNCESNTLHQSTGTSNPSNDPDDISIPNISKILEKSNSITNQDDDDTGENFEQLKQDGDKESCEIKCSTPTRMDVDMEETFNFNDDNLQSPRCEAIVDNSCPETMNFEDINEIFDNEAVNQQQEQILNHIGEDTNDESNESDKVSNKVQRSNDQKKEKEESNTETESDSSNNHNNRALSRVNRIVQSCAKELESEDENENDGNVPEKIFDESSTDDDKPTVDDLFISEAEDAHVKDEPEYHSMESKNSDDVLAKPEEDFQNTNEDIESVQDSKKSDEDTKESIVDSKKEESTKSDDDSKKSEEIAGEKRSEDDEEIVISKKKNKKKLFSDDENEDLKSKSSTEEKKSKKSVFNSSDSDTSQSDAKKKKKSLKKRKRVVKLHNSSDESEANNSDSDLLNVSRKKIRRVLSPKRLNEGTRCAEKAEKDRRKRIEEKQNLYNQLRDTKLLNINLDRVILDIDKKTNEVLVEVNEAFVKHLKPHQVDGIKFLFDCTLETVERLKKENHSSGCILAHSMGLGKTFQVVAFLHTVMTNQHTSEHIRKVLIIVPLNVAKNWVNEFDKWFNECRIDKQIFIYEMINAKTLKSRLQLLEMWNKKGGIMIITISLYSQLVQGKKFSKKDQKIAEPVLKRCLLDPGPDIVFIDEGHLLKNDKTTFNKTVSQIRTLRRVILTGTPLQNNLVEYFIMVDFVKPNLLGSKREFLNRFVNPINNGQHIDSTDYDVKVMKKRVHILHKLLKDCIHRCDYNVLVPYLQPKFEYVLSLKLTKVQTDLYRYYLDNFSLKTRLSLLADFSMLKLIWNHPALLVNYYQRKEEKELEDDDSMNDFIDDDDDSSEKKLTKKKRRTVVLNCDELDSDIEFLESHTEPVQPATPPMTKMDDGWTKQFLPEDPYQIELSAKFILLMSILEQCEILGDKILIFSQSLYNLDLIEDILYRRMEEYNEKYGSNLTYDELVEATGGVSHRWIPNTDYFRIDGKVKSENRCSIIDTFNDEDNHRARLMLISTKAGGLGINLVSANRCIIFDVSWNPSHDLQAIYRIFRYGQSKPVYVYRFTAFGTMENKIYDRQIIKQSLSHRVIDEQQIQRHFKASELSELYVFNDQVDENRPVLKLPKDRLLADMILKHKSLIVSYHEHDSLLENKPEEGLTEEERLAAWAEYERDKNPPPQPQPQIMLDSQQLDYQQQQWLQQKLQQQLFSNQPFLNSQLFNPQFASSVASAATASNKNFASSLLHHFANSSMQKQQPAILGGPSTYPVPAASTSDDYKKYYEANNHAPNRQMTQAKGFDYVSRTGLLQFGEQKLQDTYKECCYKYSATFTIKHIYEMENAKMPELIEKFEKISSIDRQNLHQFPDYSLKFISFLYFYIHCCQYLLDNNTNNLKLPPNIIFNCLKTLNFNVKLAAEQMKLTSESEYLKACATKLKLRLNLNFKEIVKKEPSQQTQFKSHVKGSNPKSILKQSNESVECITLSD